MDGCEKTGWHEHRNEVKASSIRGQLDFKPPRLAKGLKKRVPYEGNGGDFPAFLNELDFCWLCESRWVNFEKKRPTIKKRHHFVGWWMWMMVTSCILVQMSVATIVLVIFGVTWFELYVAWRKPCTPCRTVAHRNHHRGTPVGATAGPPYPWMPWSRPAKSWSASEQVRSFRNVGSQGEVGCWIYCIYIGVLPKSWEPSG